MRRRSVLIATLLFTVTLPLHARSLRWTSIDVDAQLDRDGVLTVSETQAYVFDGDWNGGERTFHVRSNQSLHLLSVERLDGANAITLLPGELSAVDQYKMMDGDVLRWRSRLPSDPEFANTALTYRIRYRLSGVLRGRDGKYVLNHDFLFPDRSGVVERFSLRLTTDPAWGGIEPVLTRTATNLQPGEGFIVTSDLTREGETAPAAVTVLPLQLYGNLAAALLLIGFAGIAIRFFFHERARGRFGRLTPASEIDEAWLQANVFTLSPEAVGAAWDDKIGAPEVAAAIASMAQRKQIATSVEKRLLRRAKLKMRLLVGHQDINGYHGTIVNKLFFNSRKETDTDAIRKHYRAKGLDLAKIIAPSIEQELRRIPRWSAEQKVVDWKMTIGILVVSVLLMIGAGTAGGNNTSLVVGTCFFSFFALVGSTIGAKFASTSLTWLPLRFVAVFAPCVPMLWFLLVYVLDSSEYVLGLPAMLACTLFGLATVNLVFALLRSTESEEKIAYRKKLMSARRYFRRQLRSAEPALRDDWFPYLIALGLGQHVESWFRAYGDSAHAGSGLGDSSSSSFSSSSGSSSFSGSSWTGGGGAFGGAGASGSWAVAAAAVGAGVSAPSSGGSSSGGSSGGGGSSSGGGGGGGW